MSSIETRNASHFGNLSTGKVAHQQMEIIRNMKNMEVFICGHRPDFSRRELAGIMGMETSSVSGRVNEMVRAGLLVELEQRKCSITGRLITPVKLAT